MDEFETHDSSSNSRNTLSLQTETVAGSMGSMEPTTVTGHLCFLISLRKRAKYAGKQHYGELARFTATGLLHARLNQEHFQY